MITDYADIEISLYRRGEQTYDLRLSVEFRTRASPADDEIRRVEGEVQIDPAELLALSYDPAAYGRALSEALFADPEVRARFGQARAIAQDRGLPVRLRLAIGESARELHGLCWETLRDPGEDAPLCTGEGLYFSRYLSSRDWRPARLRSKGELHALAVIAGPAGLDEYDLAPVDVDAEWKRVRAGLGEIAVARLPDEATGARASLGQMAAHLRQTPIDVLYLVCHGRLVRGEPQLWLVDEESGGVTRASGSDLVERVRDLAQPPRLVVLASCQSAGRGTGGGSGEALSALGPRLAAAGVPAVLAMQGNVGMETLARMLPVFFDELQVDGQVDRALAVARGAVRDRSDYWAPALYMRLRSGRIWYAPGFGDERGTFKRWPLILQAIQRGACTPILGHGLVEPLLGSLDEMAQDWAGDFHYPLASHERESLPRVAQYLKVEAGQQFPYLGLADSIREKVQSRHASHLPDALRRPDARVGDLIAHLGARQRAADPYEPHQALARLDLPIHVTTNVDDLLALALREAGKDPQVVLCPWNRHVERIQTVFDREPSYKPSAERPLVYHLFGHLDQWRSLVLTEDDYFDYLIGVTRNKDLIPFCVRSALSDAALLFLGFQVSDWRFRVLLRSILASEGGDLLLEYDHIAAQIEPDEERLLAPERALAYLEGHFAAEKIHLFWGSVRDFMRELMPRWQRANGGG